MAKREIVVVLTHLAVEQRLDHGFIERESAPPDLGSILNQHGVSLKPMFKVQRGNAGVHALGLPIGSENIELARYVHAVVEEDRAEDFAASLRVLPGVAAAYVMPRVESPLAPRPLGAQTVSIDAPADFRSMQSYMSAGPKGLGVNAVRAKPGAKGEGVRIIDVEGSWQTSHIELIGRGIDLIYGAPVADLEFRNHGTAVLGLITGNGANIDAIAPAATVWTSGHSDLFPAPAIQAAADALGAGDIMLLEMHLPGPLHRFRDRPDQEGYIAVEWWAHIFTIIQYATRRGIIVVEAAGNGKQNLDDPIYNAPAPDFAPDWRNPFGHAVDSGAIFVGAGAPPSNAYGADRSRLGFSNYGSRLDCQAQGEAVVSAGYSDLAGGAIENQWYTKTFGGTSSASALIAGTLASAQGMAKAKGRPLTPASARALLRAYGAPQQAGANPATERIGSRPNLEELFNLI